MFIALVSYWVIGLPTGCVLGFGWLGEPMGVYGFWIGLAAGVGSAALALGVRLWRLSGDVARIRALSQA
ncbi:MAG: hypothetical protein HC809_08155 [Gammaproteobacteria bacterium]|nr:hypothetical protein [Gammaproteobacteria bacterium]